MLIGLHGVMESGKDTVYSIMEELHDSGELRGITSIRRDAFADRLKLSAARALGFEGSDKEAIAFANRLKTQYSVGVHDNLFPRLGAFKQITGREYLQYYGTEAHRDVFGQDFWIDAVLPHVMYHPQDPALLVITDVRFENEATAILERGGIMWKVERKEVEKGDGHASEQPLSMDFIDVVVDNNGPFERLTGQVKSAWSTTVDSRLPDWRARRKTGTYA